MDDGNDEAAKATECGVELDRRRRFDRAMVVGQRSDQRGQRRRTDGQVFLLLQLLVVGRSGRVRRRAFIVAGRRRIAGCPGTLRPITAAVRHVDPHPVVVCCIRNQALRKRRSHVEQTYDAGFVNKKINNNLVATLYQIINNSIKLKTAQAYTIIEHFIV